MSFNPDDAYAAGIKNLVHIRHNGICCHDTFLSTVCENGFDGLMIVMSLGKRYGELENLPMIINKGYEMLGSVIVHVLSQTKKCNLISGSISRPLPLIERVPSRLNTFRRLNKMFRPCGRKKRYLKWMLQLNPGIVLMKSFSVRFLSRT
jgi:hypothetical protein